MPTSAQLKRSTLIAALTAIALLVTIVIPSEYAIDPTGAGRILGLTRMGEIKTQLATEAAADEAAMVAKATAPRLSQAAVPQELAARLERIETLLVELSADAPAQASAAQDDLSVSNITPENVAPVAQETVAVATAPAEKQDEMTISLAPGEGAEVKLVMRQGARANYAWTVDGGGVNFDMHGDGGGQSASYEKGRGVPGAEGALEAAFDGNHGWFWRNRGTTNITVILRTNGDYSEIKRVL
ncbi:hypothetical protein [Mesorhizobium sp. M7A.F.Ca.US.001.04.2.1]|uniref:hypothetical protein n=1 Tax=Mesorhizobium sp. M7A.F.Ca.US.001.04.2.1 TaxID=2496727 RepID=UPI0032B012F8